MIFDSIENVRRYRGLSPLMDQALDFLVGNDLGGMPEQRIDIRGDDVYVMIQHYDTEDISGRSFETHDEYIDIQFVISGSETIVCGNRKDLVVEKAYDSEADCTLYHFDEKTRAVGLNLESNDFAVLFPGDGHVPKLRTGSVASKVKKAVFKVRGSRRLLEVYVKETYR